MRRLPTSFGSESDPLPKKRPKLEKHIPEETICLLDNAAFKRLQVHDCKHHTLVLLCFIGTINNLTYTILDSTYKRMG